MRYVREVNSETSDAFDPNDRERIHCTISTVFANDGGFRNVDKSVSDALRGWLLGAARHSVERFRVSNKEDTSNPTEMLRVGKMLQDMGKLDEAEPLYRRALEHVSDLLGRSIQIR